MTRPAGAFDDAADEASVRRERRAGADAAAPVDSLRGAVLALQRQAGNRAVAGLLAAATRGSPTTTGTAATRGASATRSARTDARSPSFPNVQREPGRGGGGAAGTAATPAAITRSQFKSEVGRFGVTRVFDGTLAEQVVRLNRLGGPGDLLQQEVDAGYSWTQWGPGASSPLYAAILAGLEDFARSMGGVPAIREIGFFERDFRDVMVEGRRRIAWAQAAAEYGAGSMVVYKTAEQQATGKVLPRVRDTSGSPAAADQPTAAEGIRRVVTHELGHGLQEVAHDPAAVRAATTPLMMDAYAPAVGWTRSSGPGSTGGSAWRLYDIGEPSVQSALRPGQAAGSGGGTAGSGQLPDERYRVTPDNWQLGWREQPISRYQVSSGPFEDFAESVMGFIEAPATLLERSPARHAFVQSQAQVLASRLQQPTAAGGKTGARPSSAGSSGGAGSSGAGSSSAGSSGGAGPSGVASSGGGTTERRETP
jgi:hypothetical protein